MASSTPADETDQTLTSGMKIVSKQIHADIIKNSTKSKEGPPETYLLKTHTENLNERQEIKRCTFGKQDPSQTNKNILMMGETGAGKSTLINVMINRILGVKWEDKYRFEIVAAERKSQTQSQTDTITVYEVFGSGADQKIPFSLTIIDTPGFGDTRGIEQDKLITMNLNELFNSPEGVDKIDAICFVLKASQARLTTTQRYIFDSVLSIFGKDVENNITVLTTFADNEEPSIIASLVEANIPCLKDKSDKPVYYKFNNVFAQQADADDQNEGSDDEDDDDDDEDDDDVKNSGVFQEAWKMSMGSLDLFFASLDEMAPKSLVLTQLVLQKREQLEATMQMKKKKVEVVIQGMEYLKKTKDQLTKYEQDIITNKDFTFRFQESVKVKNAVEKKARNCNVCKETCHYPCTELFWCKVMVQNKCRVCLNKCDKDRHSIEMFIYTFKTKEDEATLADLKRKYAQLQGESATTKSLLHMLFQEIDQQYVAFCDLIMEMMLIKEQLDSFALRPNPISKMEYVDLLIEQATKEGKLDRVATLREMKQKLTQMW